MKLRLLSIQVFLLACVCAVSAGVAHADTPWSWNYAGAGVTASGTLLTADIPNAAGFYEILSITGSRNGDIITGLYPAGSAIPGNEPFVVDNLIRIDTGQITVEGFGYSLASGAYANPYYADFLTPATYSEVFTQGTTFAEVPVLFDASPVPESTTASLLLVGLLSVAARRVFTRH